MLSRRRFLAAGAATVSVVAYDQIGGGWLTAAGADSGPGAIRVPPSLVGKLVTDEAVVNEAADDFGHIVSLVPWAVLRATSDRDVATLIKWAKKVGLPVAARGQAHSVFGEGQVEGGVVVDMNGLNTIHEITDDHAVVDAGVTWAELLDAALVGGRTPLVLTDYLPLSVGGVLSVGGIGGNMNQVGMVVDNVDALTVVTGTGALHRNISLDRKRDLFEGALGGLGQAGIITRAKVRLGPAPALVRIYELTYTDPGAYLDDQRTLVRDGRFGYHEGQIVSDGAGGWLFRIEVGAYYTPPSAPDDAALLAGLTPDAGTNTFDLPYAVWLSRVSAAEEQLRAIGLWDLPHPWSDLFVPDQGAERYITDEILPRLTPEGVGAGLILFYPFRTAKLSRPLARVPEGEIAWAFDILRFPFDPTLADSLLTENRELYDAVTEIGGTFYPVGALETTPADWVDHFGSIYPRLVAGKKRYDPAHILTPGQGVF